MSPRRESRREHWDRFWSAQPVAEIYEAVGAVHAEILRQGPVAGLRVLEVGAGSGRDAIQLAARGAAVTVLDYSEPALAAVRSAAALRGGSLNYVRGDALALPFAGGSFDVVYHQGLLEHFRNPAPVLAENARVLAPGGLLLVDVPQRWHYYTLIKRLLIALDRWFAGWERSFSIRELEGLLRAQGLRIVTAYGSWPVPGLPYRILRQVLLRLHLARLPMRPRRFPVLGRAGERLRAGLRYKRLGQWTAMVIGVAARRPAAALAADAAPQPAPGVARTGAAAREGA